MKDHAIDVHAAIARISPVMFKHQLEWWEEMLDIALALEFPPGIYMAKAVLHRIKEQST